MPNAIEPRVFDENIEAVDEGTGRRAASGIGLGRGGDCCLLELWSLRIKRMPESDLLHDYGGNCPISD